jgi:hypothetical protein
MLNTTKKNVPKRKIKGIGAKGFRDLEKILDRLFSEFIRLRDADNLGYVSCITCGSIHYWKDIDCGHYIPRARQATRYDPMNSHCQCKKCNRFRGGEHDIYEERLIEKYGEEKVKDLKLKAKLGGKYDTYLLQQLIIEYREKVKQLKLERRHYEH